MELALWLVITCLIFVIHVLRRRVIVDAETIASHENTIRNCRYALERQNKVLEAAQSVIEQAENLIEAQHALNPTPYENQQKAANETNQDTASQ